MNISEKDLYYTYTTRGYMLYYKENPIGGAGIGKYVKGCKANLSLFKKQADFDKRMILNGYGEKRYIEEIKKIRERNDINE